MWFMTIQTESSNHQGESLNWFVRVQYQEYQSGSLCVKGGWPARLLWSSRQIVSSNKPNLLAHALIVAMSNPRARATSSTLYHLNRDLIIFMHHYLTCLRLHDYIFKHLTLLLNLSNSTEPFICPKCASGWISAKFTFALYYQESYYTVDMIAMGMGLVSIVYYYALCMATNMRKVIIQIVPIYSSESSSESDHGWPCQTMVWPAIE